MTIDYHVSFEDAATHHLDVSMRLQTDRARDVVLALAAWTPGSYLVRDYARHVSGVMAVDAAGQSLLVHKTQKNRWQIACPAGECVVQYRVYGRELTVRTNFIDDSFALLTGAATFLWPLDAPDASFAVRIQPRCGQDHVYTAMKAHPDGDLHHYIADSVDTLLDSPFLIGQPATFAFKAGGKPHELVVAGDARFFDGRKAADDAAQIVEAHRALWGDLPYARYLFLTCLAEGRGGLEHKDSSVLMASPYTTKKRQPYLDWLCLVSHEHFHVWNIKRLRPQALGPFDYERENYTVSLWVAEGLTAYYDTLQVRRAGLMSDAEYLAELTVPIRSLEATPGRLKQTLAESSFDAWIKLYRPDESSRNSSISYYGKGAVVGLLLDATIRRLSHNTRSLDDVMRRMRTQYSAAQGFAEADFRRVASEVANYSLEAFFAHTVDSVGELDYAPMLEWFGLRFASPSQDAAAPYLGVTTRQDHGGMTIAEVSAGGPGAQAGLQVEDEIVAIGNLRVTAETFSARLALFRPEEVVSVLLSRRGGILARDVKLARRPVGYGDLEVLERPTPDQLEARRLWLEPFERASGAE